MTETTPSTTARRCAVLISAMAAASLLGLGLAPAAQAHNTLTTSTPEDGEKLDTAPEKVTLTFNDDVGSGNNAIAVTGPDGKEYQRGEVDVDGDTASIALKPLAEEGEYTVGYRIISADGHPLEEELKFTATKGAVQGEGQEKSSPARNGDDTPAGDESPGTRSGPLSAYGPVGGAVAAIAVIAVIVILIVRLRSRSRGGE